MFTENGMRKKVYRMSRWVWRRYRRGLQFRRSNDSTFPIPPSRPSFTTSQNCIIRGHCCISEPSIQYVSYNLVD